MPLLITRAAGTVVLGEASSQHHQVIRESLCQVVVAVLDCFIKGVLRGDFTLHSKSKLLLDVGTHLVGELQRRLFNGVGQFLCGQLSSLLLQVK